MPRTRALIPAVLLVAGLIPTLPAAAAAAAPLPLTGAHWIWYPEGNPAVSAPVATRYLRRTFTVPDAAITAAQLVVTGDDTVDVWANGRYLAGSRRTADSWQQAVQVDLTAAVHAGSNTIAVSARNTGGPAGVLGHLSVTTAAGTTDLVTDPSWKAAQTVGETWADPATSDAAWPAAADLGTYGAAPWNSAVAAPNPDAASAVTVAGLTTERQVNPVGIDAVKPRFGWHLTSATAGQVQGAYQVQVGAAAGGSDVWDSGRVPSDRSVDVEYGGPALASNRTYFWRVRPWDAQGRAAAWSRTATFDTALYDPAHEWHGAFIGATPPPALTGASWIWYPEGDPTTSAPAGTRYFRRDFTLASVAATATLVVTGDDTADVSVNGTTVSTSPRVTDSWKTAATLDVTRLLRAGANTITVTATNTTDSPAGIVAKLVAGTTTIVTDAAWSASPNNSAFTAAKVLAAYGSGPWAGNVLVPSGAPYLRHTFTVDKPVLRARLMTTALGLHETYLNGAKVGDEHLAPGWTDYNKRLQYRVSDVTAALHTGANALGALLGNGWYSGNVGFAGTQIYGTSPAYSAQLSIEYTDGTTATVATDGSWRVAGSFITANDLYQGENEDARAAIAGWNTAGFNDSAWAQATVVTASPHLVAQVDPGVTIGQQLTPVAITQPKPGVFIADLGQNFAGWDRLTVRGAAGTTVTLRHGEILNPDGTLYTTNLRNARATDSYTLAGTGTDEVFEPHFTIHGYRYVEITGFPGTPTVASLTGLAAWTDGAATGTFTSSDAGLNQVQHNILWGERSNMLSVPTDCPQRDERLGWMGDIGIFAATSTFNIDVHGLLDKFSDDVTDAQHADGAFTDVSPDVIGGGGKAGWADAGVIVPYTLWQRYGDVRVVDEHYAAMAKWVDYSKSTAGADLIRNTDTFGDWLNVDDNTANDLISTAFFSWSARLVSRMAGATGRTADALRYGQLADQVAAAFASKYIAADGTVSGNTQTGYVLALAFGLVPTALVQPVADKLAAKVASRSGHLSVGFLGVENLLPVLADHGHVATAYQILQQPDYPGWEYMSSRGATTIWERWDGIRTDGSLQDPGMNSFNHYGLGSVGDWLYRGVGGLGPQTPGYQRLLIAPQPGGSLTSASASLQTPYGPARSDWTKSGSALTLHVVVPPNATATVRIPAGSGAVTAPPEAVPAGAGSYLVPSGSWTFTA